MTRALVAIHDATVGGVYYSNNINFADLTIQPTWTKYATTGLANTLIKVMRNDYFTPYDDIYVQLDNDDVYRWNGVSWTKVMDLATARTLSGYSGGLVGYIAVNNAKAGELFLPISQTTIGVKLLKSVDYGANWSVIAVASALVTSSPYVSVYDRWYVVCIGKVYRGYYYSDGGVLWTWRNLWNNSAGGAPIKIDPKNPTYFYYRKDSADADLLNVLAGGATTELQNGYSLTGLNDHEHRHWIDPDTSGHQRIIRSSGTDVAIFSTVDLWANFVDSTPTNIKTVFPLEVGALTAASENADFCMFGITEDLSGQGLVEAFVGDNPTQSYIIAGTNWNTPPYTSAIPYTTTATVAFQGIWVGEGDNSAQRGVMVYSVETDDYDYDHQPMIGDRSAHHVMSYPNEHAEDVQKSTPYIHAPFPGPSGYGIVSDGSKWTVTDDQIATLGDIQGAVEVIIYNPHPGSTIDECTVRAYVNGKVYWSSHRAQGPDDALGYEYAYNTVAGTNAELSSQAGQAGWQSAYNVSDGLIYTGGQLYADTILYRSAVWTINPATGAVTYTTMNAAGEATGDINELIGIIDDGTQLVFGERGPTALTDGSDYPNGGGVWTVPKATIGTPASFTRVYEDSATPKREWRFMAKHGSTYLGLLYETSTGVGKYAIQSSTNLTVWNVDINGMALSLNDIRPAMIYHTANGIVYAATVNSSRQIEIRTYNGAWSVTTFTNLTVPATGIVMITLGTSGNNLVMTVSEWTTYTHSVYLIYNLDSTPNYIVYATGVDGANNTSFVEAGPDVYYCTCYPGALVRLRLGNIDGHDLVTLDADADTKLSVSSGQQITYDVQNANTVLAGPTSGAAAKPNHRALVSADLPAISLDSLSDVNTSGAADGEALVYNGSSWVAETVSSVDLPYGSFSSSATQTIDVATTAYAITYTDRELTNQITLTSNSHINILVAGTYLITFSAIGASSAPNKYLDIWLAVDGTNVPRTNTHSEFVGTHNERIITVTFLYDFTAGQYFELYMHSNDTGATLVATAAGASPTRPASPSIIVTVNKVSDTNPEGYLLMETGDRLLMETDDKILLE